MTVIAIIIAGSALLQFSSLRDLVVNMRQPHFARTVHVAIVRQTQAES